ncbi:MAG: alpha-1,2-fucosyltransferase, partial [Nitrosotalea sp.]
RLGNQLFQMATTISLALENNDDYVFPMWEYAAHFNLKGCFSGNIPNHDTFKETNFLYTPIPYRPNLNIEGFFQSEKYFIKSQDIIQSLLTPKIGFPIQWGYTSIHVRRGDYLNLQREYNQLEMDYYTKSMQMVSSQHYLVFSDDIAWCKANFHGENIKFSEGKSPTEDLALMLSCEHNIIANSSFSWWGAYLNKNPSKMVIAPQRWFGPNLPHNTKDLLPEKWIKI